MASTAEATLVPPQSRVPSRGARLRKPVPAPAGLRPKKNKYQLPVWLLYKVPKRLLAPPKPTGFASVRSFKSTPLADIRLADVIANKHLSPLSLKDFEGYLVYREHSAENLYCLLWLNEYTKEWNEWKASAGADVVPAQSLNTDPNAVRKADHLPPYLAESLQGGLAIFFTPNGPLELNLSANTRAKTLVAAGDSGDPADFAEARDIIEHSLNRSLAIYSRGCVANAGPRRLVFCFCLGFFIFLLGLIPPFVAIFGHHARAWRAIGLPLMVFGASVCVMAVKRICGVIWLLGEDRQLLPNELAPPLVTSSSVVSLNCPSTPRSNYSCDSDSTYSAEKHDVSFKTANSSDPYPWEKDDQQIYGHATSPNETSISFAQGVAYDKSDAGSTRPPSYSTATPTTELVPESAPVFGPVTRVYSPDVVRAQWALVIQSFMWGTLYMVIVGAVLMAVPNQS